MRSAHQWKKVNKDQRHHTWSLNSWMTTATEHRCSQPVLQHIFLMVIPVLRIRTIDFLEGKIHNLTTYQRMIGYIAQKLNKPCEKLSEYPLLYKYLLHFQF